MTGPDSLPRFDAVLFDLLTALLDSWILWGDVAGSPSAGRAWREEYLALTYAAGDYRPYESVVAEAAERRAWVLTWRAGSSPAGMSSGRGRRRPRWSGQWRNAHGPGS